MSGIAPKIAKFDIAMRQGNGQEMSKEVLRVVKRVSGKQEALRRTGRPGCQTEYKIRPEGSLTLRKPKNKALITGLQSSIR
jgi:hypothetical protein